MLVMVLVVMSGRMIMMVLVVMRVFVIVFALLTFLLRMAFFHGYAPYMSDFFFSIFAFLNCSHAIFPFSMTLWNAAERGGMMKAPFSNLQAPPS